MAQVPLTAFAHISTEALLEEESHGMQDKFEFYRESKREGNMLSVSHQGGDLQPEMLLSPEEKGPK